jgi:UDP-N-acetylglucosamine--N-acetylmuramyl-(pentapeptide) pyrophosphoryl-undecaprenol N-acetylglucosamine transferase
VNRYRVVLAGGGTGGHVYPLLAVAEAAGTAADFVFIGGRGMESQIAPSAGVTFQGVPVGAVVAKRPDRVASSLVRTAVGVWKATRLLRRFGAQVVVSTGGYAGYPAARAAGFVGLPVVLIEPNAVAGLANRALGRRARRVCVAFAQTASAFPGNAVWTGVPLRASLWSGDPRRAVARYGLDPRRRTLLVMGGSQGAASINRATARAAEVLRGRGDLQILHQTGTARADLEPVDEQQSRVRHPTSDIRHPTSDIRHPTSDIRHPTSGVLYRQTDYLDPIADAYALADLVVARAGAVTCAELTALGLAAILVPLAHSAGHQGHNARALQSAGAAVVVPDAHLNGEHLARVVSELLGYGETLERMREASRSLGRPDASRRVWNEVRSVIEQRTV